MTWRLILILVTLSAGFTAGWRVCAWRDQAAAGHAEHAELQQTRRSDTATAQLGAQAEARAVEIRTVYRNLVREVPAHVTPAADDRCIVPVGFVRAHDAAAQGLPVSQPSGGDDDAASGLALSTVAAAVTDNYGTCAETAQRLTSLQAWVRQQQDLWGEK